MQDVLTKVVGFLFAEQRSKSVLSFFGQLCDYIGLQPGNFLNFTLLDGLGDTTLDFLAKSLIPRTAGSMADALMCGGGRRSYEPACVAVQV